MKKDKSKRPTRAKFNDVGEKRSNGNRNFSKSPSRAGGALTLKRENGQMTDIARIIDRTGYKFNGAIPELLAPAGSLDSLKAAIAAGADAVYFGGGDFNARINAKNFTNDEIAEAIALLHSCGRKAYITLNTLVHDREMDSYLRFAEFVYKAGADALIVADLGGAMAIRRHLPELELHASTQMSGHNVAQAKLLSECGFSRMVCARELPKEDIDHLVKNSPIEIEAFVHGALCVCHSGQCLFSSLVGGRSGNRGECAQPCRLPYKTDAGDQSYPLSLKDLSLAEHITELINSGVHSLKIEGRMKSPEYVYGVVRAFRTLLDEHKNATTSEMSNLAKVFSRGGFTDGYYKRKIDSSMLGIRSDEEKQISRIALTSSEKIDAVVVKKQEISALAIIKADNPISLSLSCGDICVTAYGQIPDKAINAPITAEGAEKNLSKLGATPFVLSKFEADIDADLIVPISALNFLRREACEMLENALRRNEKTKIGFDKYIPLPPDGEKRTAITARFYSADQITRSAREFFDIIYLPLQSYSGECEGILLPPVIFDSELQKIEKILIQAKKMGAKYALVGNLGALELAKKHGFAVHGDFRFNAYNNESVAKLEKLGVENIILSPELTLPQIRDVKGDIATVVYGRIPLMLLEKCVVSEVANCNICAQNTATITDRKGVSFPVLREYEHRNTVYNSAPTYMADRESELVRSKITNRHFIFSIESANEVDSVISAYRDHTLISNNQKIRRI